VIIVSTAGDLVSPFAETDDPAAARTARLGPGPLDETPGENGPLDVAEVEGYQDAIDDLVGEYAMHDERPEEERGTAARPRRLSTAALRTAWRPYLNAEDRMERMRILGWETPVNPETKDAWRALDRALTAAGYRAHRAWVFVPRAIKGTSSPSLHAYGLAIDIDHREQKCNVNRPTPDGRLVRFATAASKEERCRQVQAGTADTVFTPRQVAAVESIRTAHGHQVFWWGGRWNDRKDTMHFQINVTPEELRHGLAAAENFTDEQAPEEHELEFETESRETDQLIPAEPQSAATQEAFMASVARAALNGELLLEGNLLQGNLSESLGRATQETEQEQATEPAAPAQGAIPVIQVEVSIRTDFTIRTPQGVQHDWSTGEPSQEHGLRSSARHSLVSPTLTVSSTLTRPA